MSRLLRSAARAPVAALTLVTALGACAIPDTQFLAVDGGGSGSDAELTIVTSATMLEVNEAADGAVMVSLNRAPAEPLHVTAATLSTKIALGQAELVFTADDFAQPQALTITGLSDPDTVVEQAEVTLSAPGVTSVAISTTVHDDDVMQIVSDLPAGGMLTINEAGTATVRVHMSAQPTSEIRVDALVGAGPISVVGGSSLVFSPLNYDADQTLTFAAADDANIVNEDVALTLRSMGVPDRVATLRSIDDDTLNLAVTPSSLSITEQGAAGAIMVSLTQQPPANVTVTIATSTGQATLDRTQLTFTPQNYAVNQAVNVSAPDDLNVADGSDTVRISSTGLTDRTVAVTIRDNDIQQLLTSASPLSVAENGTTTFNATLRYQPTTDVVVAVSSLSTAVATVNTGVLRFTSTDYATPHPVTVRGTDDLNLVTNNTTIRLSEASLANLDIPVSVTDDDTQRIVVSATALNVPEGMSRTFTAALAYEPLSNVTCSITSSNAAALLVNPSTISFSTTNYATPVTITVAAPADSNNVSEMSDIKITGCGAPVPATVMATSVDSTMLYQFGWPMPFTTTVSIPQGTVIAYRISVTPSSNLDSFGIWVPAATGDFRMALYSNANNAPAALVAQMPARRALVNGSNTADITPDPLIPAGDYWLVLRVGQSTAIGYSAAGITGSQCIRNIDLPSLDDPWPNAFGAASCTTDRLINLWINSFAQP
ncbi:MAG: hypothetical protein R3B48_26505 [Kofleriaceae bacterium]